jgi:Ras-related protein Rab-7A
LVYDITNEKSFDQLNSWRDEFLNQSNPKDPDNFTFIVLGNKVDREAERRVAKSKATQWCKSKTANPIPYFETSAKDATKVEAAFLEAAQAALHQEAAENDVFIPDTINLSKKPAPAKSGGCC